MTVDQVIAARLKLRRYKDMLETKHSAEIKPITEQIDKIDNWLQSELQKRGLQNFSSVSGTAFLKTKTDSTSHDWDATLKWIIETGAYEFLEKRVSKTAITDYMEQHGEAPPGISVTRYTSVGVRSK